MRCPSWVGGDECRWKVSRLKLSNSTFGYHEQCIRHFLPLVSIPITCSLREEKFVLAHVSVHRQIDGCQAGWHGKGHGTENPVHLMMPRRCTVRDRAMTGDTLLQVYSQGHTSNQAPPSNIKPAVALPKSNPFYKTLPLSCRPCHPQPSITQGWITASEVLGGHPDINHSVQLP